MKQILLYVMILAYTAAGVNHFINPKWYMRIMPPWLPAPTFMNMASGALEIAFALLLIPEATRSIGAWLLIALLIAVFPANIQMCINYAHYKNPYLWVTYLRLPLQVVLIWWAYQYTK